MKHRSLGITTGGIVALISVAIVVITALWLLTSWISYSNQEKSLRAEFSNETRANQADFDNMWKTIAQKYQIKGDYEKTFKEIFAQVATGRAGGVLFKSVQEAAPGMDISLHKEMMATIEGKRNQFQSRQMKLSDIKMQHDKLLTLFPGSMFVGGRPALELKMVTSTRTDNAFSTGQDNDVDLAPKPPVVEKK